jgi:hypothetical protein
MLIQAFYDCLEIVFDEHGMRNSAHRIWNCDETEFMFATTESKVGTNVGRKIYRR